MDKLFHVKVAGQPVSEADGVYSVYEYLVRAPSWQVAVEKVREVWARMSTHPIIEIWAENY